MQYGWTYKQFKTREAFDKWVEKNKFKVQWVEIYVNNVVAALEYKKLRVINIK